MIKLIILTNNQILISKIEEVGADIGEPDCKLIDPYLVNERDKTISPWLFEYSEQNTYMINSDKILTLFDPGTEILKKYQRVTE